MSNQWNNVNAQSSLKASSEPQRVRSRWTPKAEQILILESVFNSGMVNPSKDQTLRITSLLENFGPVCDTNVFYWFQNRRSRFRRRQRQIQAQMEAHHVDQKTLDYNPSSNLNNNDINMIQAHNAPRPPFLIPSSFETLIDHSASSSSSNCMSSVFSSNGAIEGFQASADQMGFQGLSDNLGSQATIASSFLCTSDITSEFPIQQPSKTMHVQHKSYLGEDDQGGFGIVTVFINGVPTEVPMGPLDMKEMCGHDFILVHSSGLPVLINEYGYSTCSLQHGESYFLVHS